MEEKNILDVLFDEGNKDPIVLLDSSGKNLTFEQIAVIPENDKIYCVLKPIDSLGGLVAEDEAIVFRVEKPENGEPFLVVETNESTAITIFEQYYDLLEEDIDETN